MTTLKQILSGNSLKIIEKMLSSKDARLKKKIEEILPRSSIYHISKEYERAHNQTLEILDFYNRSSQEEITQ
jgi:3-methyladenine DNA glycosylase AlkD